VSCPPTSQGKPAKEIAVAKVTRNLFLKQASAGAVTVGALAALPGMTAAHAAPKSAPAEDLSPVAHRGPLVAHVKDASTGEISFLIGTREIKVHNPELVKQLVKAAR
jgi:hypothetical protein